jgi:glycosyltransferase involved in cell wall biosynthesis
MGAGPLDASVVIPVRDDAETIGAQLDALALQRTDPHTSWEIVAVDNGSRDDSVNRLKSYVDELRNLRVVDGSDQAGPGHARNVGACAARGRALVFCDADDIVGPDWLRSHLSALVAADAAYGPIREFHIVPPSDFDGSWARRDLSLVAPFCLLPSGNMSVRKVVFDDLGGFTTDVAISEDMDFSVRLQRAGYTVGYAPEAKLYWRRPQRASSEFRKQRAYALRARRTLTRLRYEGVIGERVSPAWKKSGWLLLHLPAMVSSRQGAREWASVAGKLAGQIEWWWATRQSH